MKHRQSAIGVSMLLITANIILASELDNIIRVSLLYNTNSISTSFWINFSLVSFFWLILNSSTFILLKSELKLNFSFKKSFYIMLLPLIIFTIGIFPLVLAIKCNQKKVNPVTLPE